MGSIHTTPGTRERTAAIASISAVGARGHGGLPPLEQRARRGEGVCRGGDRKEIGEALAELGEDVALQPARVVAVVEGEAHLGGGRKSGVSKVVRGVRCEE